MSWLVDTDVLSQPIKRNGNQAVIEWLEREQAGVFTSSVVIAQVALWIRTKEGAARERLQSWLRQSLRALEGRVLSVNVGVAHVWAEQQIAFEKAGVRMPLADSYIAATARRYNLTIATGNDKDFRRPGLKVFNPFKELSEA